jgi:hypothetical protein
MFKLILTRIALLAVLAFNLSGCAEARFELSPESRLPKWFEVPEGMSRDKLKVTVDYYINSSGGEAIFKLYNESGTRLRKISGEMGIYPLQLEKPSHDSPKGYPMYEIVMVDGVTDIIEHRERNDIFYMTDDPAVWKELTAGKR